MRCFLVGISGYSKTGKDTVAHWLVKRHNAIHLGMTDHAKRHMADAYGFSEEQLFGPSEARNGGDLRYPKSIYFENKCRLLEEVPQYEICSGETVGLTRLDQTRVYHTCEGRGPAGTEKLSYEPIKLGAARYFIEEGDPCFWLSPREALQRYCELLEELYRGSLIDYAVQTHLRLIPRADPGYPKTIYHFLNYHRMNGLTENSIPRIHEGHFMTCFSDFRRKHQIQGARDLAGNKLIPVMIRVKRPGIEEPPFKHVSETEQADIPDSAFDFILDNDGDINELNVKINRVMETILWPGWKPVETSL